MPRYSVAESANTHTSIVPFVFGSSLSSPSSSLSALSNRRWFCRRLHRRRLNWTARATARSYIMLRSARSFDEEQQYSSSVVEVPSLSLISASSSFGSGSNITKQAVSDKAGTVVSSSTDQLDSFVVHTVSSSTIHAPVSDSREGTTQTETNKVEPNAVSTPRRSLVIISGLIFAAVAIGTLEKGSLIDYEMIASVQKRRYAQLYLTGGRTASSDTLSTSFGVCDSYVDLPTPLRPSEDNATTNNSTITYALYLIAIVGIIALLVRTRMPYDPVADGGSNSSAEHQNVNGDSERDNNELNVSHNHDDDSDNINDF